MSITEQIRALLASLGATADEVALNLDRMALTGRRDDGCDCPIARLIQATFNVPAEGFKEPDWTNTCTGDSWYVTRSEVYTPQGTVSTPPAVDSFIYRFDCSEYPDLIEVSR